MPIKIHHGPNGSYKTSGAVWDDAVVAMKAGRVLITNVRGMSTERCLALLPDLPESFELININTQTVEGLHQARTWFHWAPKDAFLIFDEPQTIFLKKWSDKALEQFDFPGGPDAANAADRPTDFLDAWTRHRHWNWDVVLCTPNIRYLRDDIRQTSETAYLHTNLGILGQAIKFLLRADYKEVMHNAQDNKPSSDGKNIVHFRKIDKRVFQLYDSTATGEHRDTFTGQSLLGSPKVVLPVGFLAVVLAVMYQRTGFSLATDGLHGSQATQAVQAAPPAVEVPASAPADLVGNDFPDAVSDGDDSSVGQLTGPFSGVTLTIKACLHNERVGVICMYQAERAGKTFTLKTVDLKSAGYQVVNYGLCAAEITYRGSTFTAVCSGEAYGGRADERSSERGGEAGVAPASQPASSRLTVVNSGKPGHMW